MTERARRPSKLLTLGGPITVAAIGAGTLLGLACKTDKEVLPQTPTPPEATAQISPTAYFDFTIPPDDLVSWEKAHEYLRNREAQIGGPFIDNEEITITAFTGSVPEQIAPALIATIKRPEEYDVIQEKYAAILAERFDPLDICNIQVTDEYGTVVYRGIQWVTNDGNSQDASLKELQTPNCN